MSPKDQLLARAVTWFAANGIGDTSLRTLATALGTSHRMLIYHFGSREGLLAAVVEAVERGEQQTARELLASHDDPYAAGAAFWARVADTAQTFAPLFFELSAAAMHDRPYAGALREWLTVGWLDVIADGFRRSGFADPLAGELARLSVATARGLLLELAVTGDRPAVDAAMDRFTDLVRGLPLTSPGGPPTSS